MEDAPTMDPTTPADDRLRPMTSSNEETVGQEPPQAQETSTTTTTEESDHPEDGNEELLQIIHEQQKQDEKKKDDEELAQQIIHDQEEKKRDEKELRQMIQGRQKLEQQKMELMRSQPKDAAMKSEKAGSTKKAQKLEFFGDRQQPRAATAPGEDINANEQDNLTPTQEDEQEEPTRIVDQDTAVDEEGNQAQPIELQRQDPINTRLNSTPGAFSVGPSVGFTVPGETDSDDESGSSENEDANDNDEAPAAATVNAHLVEEEDRAKDQEIQRLREELQAARQQQQQAAASIAAVEPVETIQPFDIQNAKKDIINEDNSSRKSTKALPFDSMPQKLFGREEELQQLQVVLDFLKSSDQDQTKQLLQIGGVSGSGKSALALQLKEMLQAGVFLSGKIDAALGDPYAALGSALETFCQSLLDGSSPVSKEAFRTEYSNQLDDEDLELLSPIVPSLCNVLDTTTALGDNSTSYMEAKARFQHAVKRFIQVLCTFGPVVLVIDDTQWIQPSLLDLMGDLLDHEGSTRFLLVTTFRDNEVDEDHVYCKAVEQWKQLTLKFTDIRTGELGPEDVLQLLVSLLSTSDKKELEPLALCVHKKTAGLCFFVKEFLISLQSSGLLLYDDPAGVWAFDIKDISEAADATDNVVGLLSNKLHKLGATVQSMLPKLAALGSTFPSTVAQIVVHDSISGSGDARGSTEFLLLLIQEGLLVECRRGWFKWEHDKLREAAMSFADGIHEIRFQVGKLLLRELSEEELQTSVFTVTDLLNANVVAISLDDPLYDQLINLNLRSGKLALKTSAFNASAMYLDFGISLLPNTKWTSHFEDTRELYSTAAEAQYCIGDHIKCKEYAEEVKASPCLLLQRKRAENVLVASLYAQEKTAEARDLIVELLAELGCTFPSIGRSVMGPLKIMAIAMNVNKSTNTLTNAPPMLDEKKKWVITLLDKLCLVTYICDKALLPLGIAKALSWSEKHGKCAASATALANVALILAGSLNDFAGAKKFADVALSFMDSSTASKTTFLCYQFALHYQIPIQDCIAALANGFVMGVRSGDLVSAFWCEYSALDCRLIIGEHLTGILEGYKRFHMKLATQKNDMIEYCSRIIYQVVKNLSDPDPSNHRSIDAAARDDNAKAEHHMRRYTDRIGVTAAFWMYNYEEAIRLINSNQYWDFMYEKQFPGANGTGTLYFYCALILLFAPGVAKRKQHVMKFLKRLREWKKKGNPNVGHYISLIEADLASVNKKPANTVTDLYKKAISDAAAAGFFSDVALATERYGDHFERTVGLGDEAKEQYQQALKRYEEYGALGRVTLLQKRHNLVS